MAEFQKRSSTIASRALHGGDIVVLDYRCTAGRSDSAYEEVHQRHSLSYVRRGSFGCRVGRRHFELVAGSFLVGRPDDGYLCTHDHHDKGDDCLSVQLSPALADELGAKTWESGGMPPVAELGVAAERTLHAASGHTDIGVDEAGLLLVSCYARLKRDTASRSSHPAAGMRHAMVEVAAWIESQSAHNIDLAGAAHRAGLSPFHFLRSFKAVIGITPHQYLLQARLRSAARRLLEETASVTETAFEAGFSDLSNFMRSFRKAAGVSPRRFRLMGQADRKILQDFASTPGFAASH